MTLEVTIAGGVATLALNRPEVRNALNLEMCDELVSATGKLGAYRPGLAECWVVRARGIEFRCY